LERALLEPSNDIWFIIIERGNVKLFVIEVGRRFYKTHLWGNAIVLPLWGRVRIEPSRMETLQGSMSSGVLWRACKPLQCNSTCNTFKSKDSNVIFDAFTNFKVYIRR
jgi:hypothetical protein